MPEWHAPLDPECPVVAEYTTTLYEDPMSEYAPTDDIMESFTRRHRIACARCQEYGAANIEVR